MITARKHDSGSEDLRTAEAIRVKFAEHHEELKWLALFLTGDEDMADACVVDACTIAQKLWKSQPRRPVSPAFAAIDSAIQMQRARIAGLSPAYGSRNCGHHEHPQLPPESIALVVLESDLIASRLNTLCRFVLVICGMENFSSAEAARWLGIDCRVVEGAYCAALESLEVLECESRLACEGGVSA